MLFEKVGIFWFSLGSPSPSFLPCLSLGFLLVSFLILFYLKRGIYTYIHSHFKYTLSLAIIRKKNHENSFFFVLPCLQQWWLLSEILEHFIKFTLKFNYVKSVHQSLYNHHGLEDDPLRVMHSGMLGGCITNYQNMLTSPFFLDVAFTGKIPKPYEYVWSKLFIYLSNQQVFLSIQHWTLITF